MRRSSSMHGSYEAPFTSRETRRSGADEATPSIPVADQRQKGMTPSHEGACRSRLSAGRWADRQREVPEPCVFGPSIPNTLTPAASWLFGVKRSWLRRYLRGQTKGYLHHPQLDRFRAQPSPCGAIAEYLRGINAEAVRRGYAFAPGKVSAARSSEVIGVTRGQLTHEWNHLMAKLAIREPALRDRLAAVRRPRPHPLFRVVPGDVEPWERRPQGLPDQPLQPAEAGAIISRRGSSRV